MLQKQNIKEKQKCLSGFGKGQLSLALGKAWTDYYNLSGEQVLDKKRVQHHKRVIRKLQDNLRKPVTDFIMYEAIVWGLYNLNPELFKEDINYDMIDKAIVKTTAIVGSRMRFDLKPNMAVELMRRDKALGML